MKPAYYNEFDPYAAAWLRNLIKAGHIPAGDVDDRSIKDVTAACLAGYGQCHFFAGIGGFGLACRLAGVADDAEIWTGGFPCQPFSVAGRQLAQEDDRHLWPVLSRLIEQKRPAVFIGENVAGIIDLALDGVLFDLESAGYASRAFVVPACAVNAPHRRDRVWIAARRLADSGSERLHRGQGVEGDRRGSAIGSEAGGNSRDSGSSHGDVEHAEGERRGEGRAEPIVRSGWATAAGSGAPYGDVGHANQPSPGAEWQQRGGELLRAGEDPGACTGDFWSGSECREGADGKARRVKPGIRLLVAGVSGRVAKLRAAGNAIVPQVAAEIIRAVMGCAP